jgi:hypothetical protein
MDTYKKIVALENITETTVSSPINVRLASKVTLSFKRTNHASGGVIFSVQASIDGKEDFIPMVNMISNDVNNHSQDIERNTTVELTSDDHVFTALDLENFGYDYIQIKAVVTGSGESTCKILVENC